MKKVRSLTIPLLALLIPMTTVLAGGDRGRTPCGIGETVMNLPAQEMDAGEESDLLHMREEEKLARDVYRALDEIWGMRIFRNIAAAEDTHMRAVLSLLEKYGITDPVGDNGEGEFVDPELQALFHELIAQGSESLNQALTVGATIEDLDIFDLAMAMERTDNEDILLVYQNLQKGSRNHLRSFVALLEANGIIYVPQFLSQGEYDTIIASARETGRVDSDGEPVAGGPCRMSRHERRQEGSGSRR
jgi:hypothetical protein